MPEASKEIFKKMIAINKSIEAIAKGERNNQQNFSFRGIDTVYNALHSIFAEHEVICLPTVLEERCEDRQTRDGAIKIYRILKIKFDFVTSDGSSCSATVMGEAFDMGDKASNKAMSVAHKYALIQVFTIPTDKDSMDDPDRNQANTTGNDVISDASVEEYITDSQLKQMTKVLEDNNIDITPLLKKRGYNDLSEIPKTKYDGTMGWILNQVSIANQQREGNEQLPNE